MAFVSLVMAVAPSKYGQLCLASRVALGSYAFPVASRSASRGSSVRANPGIGHGILSCSFFCCTCRAGWWLMALTAGDSTIPGTLAFAE